ncbi:MAG: class I SAM-dependent methyltransferase [bacterium]|nr:class I SAM-dependent methyltransferase [bacterium]
MNIFNQFQYNDLKIRVNDLYANAKYEFIYSFLSNKKNLLILNAGCGSGELSVKLAQKGHTVVNIDPVQEYIDLARKNIENSTVQNITFINSSIEEYSERNKFDCVITTDVLEHIKDDRLAFQNLAQFVKSNGIIIVTVPAEPVLFGYHDKVLGHYRRYTAESLINIIPSEVKIDHLRYFGWTLIPICIFYSKIVKKEYPVSQVGTNSFLRSLFKCLLVIDKKVDLYAGTTLIALFHKADFSNLKENEK